MMESMPQTPRKVVRAGADPKTYRVTVRLGPRDLDALTTLGQQLGGANYSEAVRHLVRQYAAALPAAKKGSKR